MQQPSTRRARRHCRRLLALVTGGAVVAGALVLGAPLPADNAPLWSLQPFGVRPLPAVAHGDWPQARSDYFVLAKLEAGQLTPAGDAEPAVLFRRIHLDLTGLPPSLDEIAAFESSPSSDLVSRIAGVVDKLLASPEFGVRWGRHWLDVARYAETSGSTRNMSYPQAWRYRNYVIRAFNRNAPFDQFIREQLAGDLLPHSDDQQRDEQVLGTGFLNVGMRTLGEQDVTMYELNLADDQIDATCRAFLGLSANCARCHDHKFDPIPTRDYYALAGIFRSTKLLSAVETNNRMEEAQGMPLGPDGLKRMSLIQERTKLLDDMTKEYVEVANKRNTMRDELVKSGVDLAKAKKEVMPKDVAEKISTLDEMNKSVENWKEKVKALKDSIPPPPPVAMAAVEKDKVMNSPLFDKGEVKKPLDAVPRGALACVPVKLGAIGEKESGRRQLADWIASPRNPLTARVVVNRVWQHLFGRGIVETPDDFGKMGSLPSHPELLDDLAARFVQNGWNVKALIRELMLSRTYRLGSGVMERGNGGVMPSKTSILQHSTTPALRAQDVDPENRLFWRMNRKPLEAEPLRDSMLALSGALDRSPMEGSPIDDLGRDIRPQGRELGRKGFLIELPEDKTHRSAYLPVIRGRPAPAMQCFDAADPGGVAGARRATIVPVQSLYLMNGDFVIEQAQGMAKLALSDKGLPVDSRLERLWRSVFTRKPTANEVSALRAQLGNDMGNEEEWSQLCQVLLMTGEFRTVY